MNECNSVLVVEKMNSSGTHYSVLLEITTLMTTLSHLLTQESSVHELFTGDQVKSGEK